VYQAGTLSGNPLATAAGIATLRLLDSAAYERLERTTAMLAEGLVELGLAVSWVTGLLTAFFRDGIPRDLDEVKGCDFDRHAAFCRAMLDRGIYLPPSQYEAWFPSLAHTEAHVERTLEAARDALASL
jgi:glutamate-1-semialdehyde 2,1-aminomutase